MCSVNAVSNHRRREWPVHSPPGTCPNVCPGWSAAHGKAGEARFFLDWQEADRPWAGGLREARTRAGLQGTSQPPHDQCQAVHGRLRFRATGCNVHCSRPLRKVGTPRSVGRLSGALYRDPTRRLQVGAPMRIDARRQIPWVGDAPEPQSLAGTQRLGLRPTRNRVHPVASRAAVGARGGDTPRSPRARRAGAPSHTSARPRLGPAAW